MAMHAKAEPQSLAPIYAMAKAHNEALSCAATAAGKAWNAIPGVGSGPMGLTPEHIRMSPEYRQARAEYDRINSIACEYTRFFVSTFRREIAAEREAKRAAKMAEHLAR